MDKNTKLIIWIEVALVVILFAIIAGNHEPETVGTEVAAVSHEASETEEHATKAEHAEEAAPVEKAAEEKSEPEKAEAPKEEPAEEAPKAEAAAGSGEFEAVIALENPAYEKHTKGIVQFTHKKHFETYKISCGDCHHDDNAEPIEDLKPGDPVEGCIECHSKPGKAPKGETEKLEYHTNALHQNCIVCHKQYNKENKTKAAPQTCGKCHPKKKK